MAKIACVIVTYNRKQLLEEALNSVSIQAEAPEYVFVIDNASTDGTEKYINDKFNFDNRHWHYVRCSQNLGGSAGFAQGMRLALQTDCSWISISDDDALFEPGYFAALREGIKQYPEQSVFSGSVLLPDGKHDMMHREVITNSATLTVKPVTEETYKHDFSYDIFSFVGILLSRQVIEAIGLPEQDYFIRFDDFEYAVRALKFGRFMNLSAAKVLHKTTYTRSAIAPWKEYYVMRNRIALLIKHRGNNHTVRWYCRRFLLRKLLAILLFSNRRRQARSLVNAYVKGYQDGWHARLGRQLAFLPS
ncbi:glycosyltransferase family 2 protein [Lactiplantibacillus plantarum]|uniref:glycosyltransferase family 2 protein n=1 Tax=Lactiplantibacillus plantarum TaxID=1590 RepID=UPI00062DA67E|nr:glycosyltransferase family 2 protein [Lactiplantibacillus plantarum]AMR19147.1 glycosyl transferase family 2 [Lactiplantibacillus plantarum]ARW14145.1 hypothetical protein S100434_02018 [Lactiplantibacillus plantarum subsp. plantarum]KLD43285.1 glycosyl transferase family 2 [Lactiplantibacillus plantarum]KLD60643.1 glycosyl transferase family 2 [Lactiplantibacillus plantarum]KZU40388.1 glycosyltransferase [Lactiplantibacillus plantarum]